MKICFLFRGDNERHNHRGHMIPMNNIDNWNKTLFEDATSNGYSYDIVFHTYPSNSLEMLTSLLKPKYSEINPCISQTVNLKNVAKWMREHRNEYDRFIIIRFDVLYRISLTKWRCWDQTGIIIVNRDVHWLDERLCSDFIFICDKESIDNLADGLNYRKREFTGGHQVMQYFDLYDIPYHLMYTEFYNMYQHPLYVTKGEEPDPNLTEIYPGTPVPDIKHKSKTYVGLLEKNGGEFDKEHCRLILHRKESLIDKVPEISYLYTVFKWISFDSPFIEELKSIHTKKRFIYDTIMVPTFILNVDEFNLTEQEKGDFAPRIIPRD